MSRTVYVIRHGASEGNRHNQASFGPDGGGLTDVGIVEAEGLKQALQELGIKVESEAVAVSPMKRAYETAYYAGFKLITKYPALSEVGGNLPPDVLDAMIVQKEASPSAVSAARRLLAEPPSERLWVTHGQLIAGIAHELGYPSSELFIPKMGSITKLNLP